MAIFQPAIAADNQSQADIASAKALIAAGQHEPARVLLERRLAAEPGSVELLFLLGMNAIAARDYPVAVGRFRQALALQPGATRIRLELARTLFLMNKDEEADYHFKLAIAQKPPQGVIASVARYREAIRNRRSWRFNVTLGIAPDSNINSATDKEQIDIFGLPFRLDPEAQARSGTGIIVGGDASIRLRRSTKVPIYLAAYGRMVRYPDHRFNDIYAGGEAGPEFRLSGGRLRLSATALNRWYGGEQLVTSLGGRLNFDKVIGGKWALEASLAARRNNYARRSDVDSWDIEAALAANRALGPSTLGFAFTSIQRSIAEDPGHSNWHMRAGFGVLKEISWGLRPQLAFEASRQIHDAPLALFGKTRREWHLKASASLYKRDWNLAGFAPSVRVVYARNLSNITIYDQKRLRAEFGLARAF